MTFQNKCGEYADGCTFSSHSVGIRAFQLTKVELCGAWIFKAWRNRSLFYSTRKHKGKINATFYIRKVVADGWLGKVGFFLGLFLLCLSRNCYCRYGGFGITVFHSWEHSFCTSLVERNSQWDISDDFEATTCTTATYDPPRLVRSQHGSWDVTSLVRGH